MVHLSTCIISHLPGVGSDFQRDSRHLTRNTTSLTGILVSMLKKERKRVLEAESRAGNADASVASPTSATPVVTSGKTYVKSDYAGGDDDVPQEHSRVKGAQNRFLFELLCNICLFQISSIAMASAQNKS